MHDRSDAVRQRGALARSWSARGLIIGIALNAAVLVPVILVMDANPKAPWRFGIALLPMAPIALVVRAVLRAFQHMDEMQRRIQLEALAFAFAAGSLLTFTFGFLQRAGLPDVSWLWVWPLLAVLWALGGRLAHRRYLR